MNRIFIVIASALALVSCSGSGSGKTDQPQEFGLKIENLGPRNKIARICSSQKYLLLPVEESAPSCTADIIVDNEGTGSFTIPLAVNKVDFWVPFELEKYSGHNLILDFAIPSILGDNGPSAWNIDNAVCWDNIKLSDTFDSSNTELLWRPQYHFTPVYGWMNDPNGLVYKDGEWHLFYQYNPYFSKWGNMNWGHAVSRDLVHWENLPIAISPDGLGTIFSGSAVVDKDNTAGFGKDAIIAIYTSSGDCQMQSIAYSTDNGRTFTKYSGNPVITSNLVDFRDPKVIWNDKTGKWNLVLAAGDAVQFYSSHNLKDWTFESSFGKEYGNHGGVWECPDIFKVPVKENGTEKWVLIVNNSGGPAGGSATQYFVGEFDGSTFTCESSAETVKWMDWGKDHYATVSYSNAPDDRNILLTWMSNWDYADIVPTVQYRSSNSIPRDLYLYEKNGEHYLVVYPSPELTAARGECIEKEVEDVTPEGVDFGDILAKSNGAAEIDIDFTPDASASFKIELYNSKGETVTFAYNISEAAFSCDRTNSGVVDFSVAFPMVSVAPLAEADSYSLRLFLDRSSVEAFDEEGKFAMSNLIFPNEVFSGIRLSAPEGNIKVSSLKVFSIK